MLTMLTALVAPLFMLQADAPAARSASAVNAQRFTQCVALIDEDASRAYEEAMAWASEGQAINAYRCAAMALIGQNRPEEGARRLDSLASALNPGETGLRAELLNQAGNAWLMAREPARARSAFTRAIVTVESDPRQLPELLIDRARAYAMEQDWRNAEEDLSRALDIGGQNALALRLRASARMHQSAFDLAEADALAAAESEPTNVDNYLILGHIRESRRIGRPVEE